MKMFTLICLADLLIIIIKRECSEITSPAICLPFMNLINSVPSNVFLKKVNCVLFCRFDHCFRNFLVAQLG